MKMVYNFKTKLHESMQNNLLLEKKHFYIVSIFYFIEVEKRIDYITWSLKISTILLLLYGVA
jgi:hypothetical protein